MTSAGTGAIRTAVRWSPFVDDPALDWRRDPSWMEAAGETARAVTAIPEHPPGSNGHCRGRFAGLACRPTTERQTHADCRHRSHDQGCPAPGHRPGTAPRCRRARLHPGNRDRRRLCASRHPADHPLLPVRRADRRPDARRRGKAAGREQGRGRARLHEGGLIDPEPARSGSARRGDRNARDRLAAAADLHRPSQEFRPRWPVRSRSRCWHWPASSSPHTWYSSWRARDAATRARSAPRCAASSRSMRRMSAPSTVS
ncbi:MAG: hypothetical protein MZU91_08425 [Desulfosudis oleivorans]|nr:hypothetical protein [Desulfosudis oleivorans]